MKEKIVIRTDYTKIERGHQHQTGAGPHKDSRLKRETKEKILRREIDESQ